MLDTIRQPPEQTIRPAAADLAYYEAPAPPAGPDDLAWAVGQAVRVPGTGGGLCRVAGVRAGLLGGLYLAVRSEAGLEHRLRVEWRPPPAAGARP